MIEASALLPPPPRASAPGGGDAPGVETSLRVARSERAIRFVWTFANTSAMPVEVARFVFMDGWTPAPGEEVVRSGNTDGSVAVFPGLQAFIGIESPLAKLDARKGRVYAHIPCGETLAPGETREAAVLAGTYEAPSQLRREFSRALDFARGRPSRSIVHYNSWYDLNIHTSANDDPAHRMNESQCFRAMRAAGGALASRGVRPDAFLWDDGWDDWDSFWDFHCGFPRGFSALAEAARSEFGAGTGTWMSPCGGYGHACQRRVAAAKKRGLLARDEELLRLSNPVYYAAFRDRVLSLMRECGMDFFKFDRMGTGFDADGARGSTAPDMRAVVALVKEIRRENPSAFVNCTAGTWASPFWLLLADSIWRGDGDFGRKGPGRPRQQWITYRDDWVHSRFVSKAPLFPLRALMVHGTIVTRHGPPSCMEISSSARATADFADEAWMSAAAGTVLQELYVSPDAMPDSWWDVLAQAIKWFRANEAVLRDVHWIGGDPVVGNSPECEVYGYAALGCGKGIVTVRNPSAEKRKFTAVPDDLLETPPGNECAPVKDCRAAYIRGAEIVESPADTGKRLELSLEPFGVAVLELAL